jgi:hypothetical protein
MVQTLIAVVSAFTAVVAGGAAFKLWRSADGVESKGVRQFFFSFLLLTAFWALFFVHALATGLFSAAAAVTGFAVLLYSFAFFSRIPVSVHFPMYEAWIFWIGFIAATMGSTVITLRTMDAAALPLITPAWSSSMITLLGLSLGAIFAFTFLGAITFYREAARTRRDPIRYRALLLAAGYITAPVATLLTVMVGNRLVSLLFFVALSIATFLLAAGVFVRGWMQRTG